MCFGRKIGFFPHFFKFKMVGDDDWSLILLCFADMEVLT